MEGIPVVNSHNGWDQLEEVIVGVPFRLDYSSDVSFHLFFHENLVDELTRAYPDNDWRALKDVELSNRLRDEVEEDLAELIEILEREGVVVKRPEGLTEIRRIATPAWSAPVAQPLMSRDLFIVIGNEIIETAPMMRLRYFEGDMYKELFTDYFARGAKWTVAPKSRLLDRNFDFSYVVGQGFDGDIPADPFFEIMFDGPQILRLGRDLLFNCSNENHRMGLRWLQRHLGDDYRVHEIGITDHHIDAKVVALCPGTLLVETGVELSALPAPLRKWDVIRYEPLERTDGAAATGLPLLASQSIGMNVLSLDREKVVVQDIQLPLIHDLERAGFTPIPARWRRGRVLGGGFHCVSLDIRRRSVLEDYFGS